MSHHTPGPWKVVRVDLRAKWRLEIHQDKPDGGWRIGEVTFPHDAPLIAKAPELLGLLRRWLDVHGANNPNLAGQTRAILARIDNPTT